MDSELVWHYTKMNVLEKIFPPDGKNGHGKVNLRFTNVRFTNDPSEALVLKKLMLENKDKISKLLKEKFPNEDANIDKGFDTVEKNGNEHTFLVDDYIFCATHLEDSMIFWNKEYAGTDGIAIGFRKKHFEGERCEFSNVIYTDIIDDTQIKNTVDFMYKSYIWNKEFLKQHGCENDMNDFNPLINFLYHWSSTFKNKSWEPEKETRIILSNAGENWYKTPGYIQLFENNKFDELKLSGTLEPKIEYAGNKIKKVCYKSFDTSSIVSIMLGPDCKPEHEDAVRFHLMTNRYYGIRDICIKKSKAFDLQYKHGN